MAIQDDRTPNRDYPEPYGNNTLADDVLRLRQALTKIDVDVAEVMASIVGFATLLSPAFTGTPTAPTPDPSDQTGKLATTSFVAAALQSINTSGFAPINSPQFTGNPRAPTATTGDASAAIASTAFVALSLQALVGSAPAGLNTLVEIAAAIGNSTTFSADVFAIIQDPWAMFPIGVPFPMYYPTPALAPPANKSYRYVRLTAADSYNAGCIGSESVSGSAPLISATGVITLANSPLLGQTVRLLNTELRFIRPGPTPATVEENQNQSHIHGVSDPGHVHGVSDPGHAHGVNDPGHAHVIFGAANDTGAGFPTLNGNNTQNTGTGGATTNISIAASGVGIGIQAHGTGISVAAQGGTESRPRNMYAQHFMRIR